MTFRELYHICRCSMYRVKVGVKLYEYGISSSVYEDRPYITDLFDKKVIEVEPVADQILFVKLR